MHNQLPIHSFINIYRITTQGHIQRQSWLIYTFAVIANMWLTYSFIQQSSNKTPMEKRRERIKRILQGCYYWSLTFPSCGRIGTRWMFQRLASGETLVVVVCGLFFLFFFSADHQSRPAAIFVLPFYKALRLCHAIQSRDEGKQAHSA